MNLILLNLGLSNGMIKYEAKRTLNFETNEFPEFYNELTKSD